MGPLIFMSSKWNKYILPNIVHSDREAQFISEESKAVSPMFGIRQRLANPYNPQKYGTCERFKATLQTMLAKVTANHSNNWDTLLPSILFAYREVPQISTKFSLFKLIYGANHKFPLCIYM